MHEGDPIPVAGEDEPLLLSIVDDVDDDVVEASEPTRECRYLALTRLRYKSTLASFMSIQQALRSIIHHHSDPSSSIAMNRPIPS